MRFVADHDFHLHSTVSSCCHDENQTPQMIFDYAVENNFKEVCLTNHFWDDNVPSRSKWHPDYCYEKIKSVCPLPQGDNVRFLLGVETDMDFDNILGISKERLDEFDFVVVATTHFHLPGSTVKNKPETPEEAAFLWFDKLEALLKMDLPFKKIGVAHLACKHIFGSRTPEVLALLPEERLYSVFEKCAQKGLGIELNMPMPDNIDEEFRKTRLRPFYIAKDCGCKFYLGSDTHKSEYLKYSIGNFEKIITALDLKENDKFIIG